MASYHQFYHMRGGGNDVKIKCTREKVEKIVAGGKVCNETTGIGIGSIREPKKMESAAAAQRKKFPEFVYDIGCGVAASDSSILNNLKADLAEKGRVECGSPKASLRAPSPKALSPKAPSPKAPSPKVSPKRSPTKTEFGSRSKDSLDDLIISFETTTTAPVMKKSPVAKAPVAKAPVAVLDNLTDDEIIINEIAKAKRLNSVYNVFTKKVVGRTKDHISFSDEYPFIVITRQKNIQEPELLQKIGKLWTEHSGSGSNEDTVDAFISEMHEQTPAATGQLIPPTRNKPVKKTQAQIDMETRVQDILDKAIYDVAALENEDNLLNDKDEEEIKSERSDKRTRDTDAMKSAQRKIRQCLGMI